jgi:succinylglutamic semialdehyde dehydrogenase
MTAAPIVEVRGDFIGGRFVRPPPSSGQIASQDPGDLRCSLGVYPFSRGALDAAVEAARGAYPAWRDRPFAERAALLRRFAEAIQSRAEPFAERIAREIGKPLWEARTEVSAMVSKIAITLQEGMEPIAERSFDMGRGQIARSRAHARGVLAVLGPFNFPAHLPHGHIAPALATGNTIVFKPSERAAAVGQFYAEVADSVGFPEGVFNLVQGDGAQGGALAAHPGVDAVLFTGSHAVGRSIVQANLEQPWKLVVIEAGGKNGVLVAADADLAAAARAVAYGAAVTCGQRCSATSRVIAERSVAAELFERIARILAQIRIGHGLDDGVFMGPLISAAARERHGKVLEWAKAEGAQCLVEGGPCEGPRPGHYVRPSFHRVSSLGATHYQREEHFVPDLYAVEVPDFDAGIAALDDTDYGLVGSVFTRDRERFEAVFRRTRLGLLNWNGPTVGASGKLPFGGIKQSGNDRPAGVSSSLYCTYPVASVEAAQPSPADRYPGFPDES